VNTTKHYTLTKKQLEILNLLYRFRFTTAELISKTTNINIRIINQRLKLMTELKYIGRNYNSDYRIQRKPAIYYMQENGINELKKLNTDKRYATNILKAIKNDHDRTETFIKHQLTVFDICCNLQAKYGNSIQYFTKSQFSGYAHYPKPLPDAFVVLSEGDDETEFFLDILPEHPFFLSTRKVMQYVEYSNERKSDWVEATGSYMPSVLLVCENESLQKRLNKKMRGAVSNLDEDMTIYTAALNGIDANDGWTDIAKPEEKLSLDELI
jgi:hypothetical protein